MRLPSLATLAVGLSCGGALEPTTPIPPAPGPEDSGAFDVDAFVAETPTGPPPPPDTPATKDWPFESCAACGASHRNHPAR